MSLETTPRKGLSLALLAALTISLCAILLSGSAATAAKPRSEVVRVMTRNLYLGADLSPGLAAGSLAELQEAAGQIVRQVHRTNFPLRARGLAKEILKKNPDLVGLQEVALWRTAPPSIGPAFNNKPEATTVRYDFLDLLLDRLNKKGKKYKPVVVQEEFDFETPTDENDQNGDGPNAAIPNSEINYRLTMRDAILVRRGAGVRTSKPASGHFQNLLIVTVAGSQQVPVTRGWTKVDAKVRDSRKFRFVNTHLEAFDDETERPSIRAKQAGELVAPGGPAVSRLPVVLLGDLNSNDPGVQPGDEQAFQVLAGAGFKRRGTSDPLSCCISDPDLAGGSLADFDHQVDHILTDTPRKVRRKNSRVTGRAQIGGLWHSDHAGVFSALKIKR